MNPTVTSLDIVTIEPRYKIRQHNPNRMSDTMFESLKKCVATYGFWQPILVEPIDGGGYRIVDGHHRYWAHQAVGRTSISCVVSTHDNATNSALALGMNHMRGETDIGLVASELEAIIKDAEFTTAELESITGYSADMISALIDSSIENDTRDAKDTPDTDEKPEGDFDSDGVDDAPEPPTVRGFKLEIAFESKNDMNFAKRKLKSLGDGDLAAGIIAAIKGKAS